MPRENQSVTRPKNRWDGSDLPFGQAFGHWRTFEIHFYNEARQAVLHAVHPFRFYFSRLEVYSANQQLIGAIQNLSEGLTDRDNFRVEYSNGLGKDARQVVLAAAVYVDLTYFEKKG